MDLCAEMLAAQFRKLPEVNVTEIRPQFRRRFTRFPKMGMHPAAFNFDRLLNRFRDYPRHIRRYHDQFDRYHVCDHSYSQLLHELPTERTGVYCHDLDTFRCLLRPKTEPRPGWFRRMVRRTLNGFRKARVVFFSTFGVHKQIIEHDLIDPAKLVHAPYGTSPEFTSVQTELDIDPLPGLVATRFLLHVGSCIPRKRIDVLLEIFAEARRAEPDLELVQVGGEWTTDQRELMRRLGLESGVRQVRGVSRETIAALMRRAEVLLIPSEAEGFGLPVIEGLACGAVVIASDIPVLREVGGTASLYAPVADIPAWSATVRALLQGQTQPPPRETRLAWAAKYTWEAHANTILNAYRNLSC